MGTLQYSAGGTLAGASYRAFVSFVEFAQVISFGSLVLHISICKHGHSHRFELVALILLTECAQGRRAANILSVNRPMLVTEVLCRHRKLSLTSTKSRWLSRIQMELPWYTAATLAFIHRANCWLLCRPTTKLQSSMLRASTLPEESAIPATAVCKAEC